MTEADQISLGSEGQETPGEMAPIECDVHSHTAFLEQDVSILRTTRALAVRDVGPHEPRVS